MTGRVTVDVAGRAVPLSSLERVLWPSVGWTKRDLLAYMMRVAPVLLPHIRDHPLTLHRFPEGVRGPHFFQTRAPAHPPWVRSIRLTTPTAGKVVDVVILDDEPSIAWAANVSAIELHPYLGTATDFDRPTAVIFDLDPGPPADLATCCRVAIELRDILDAAGLRSWPKVSGAKGLHVHVPVDGQGGYACTRLFAEAVARLLVDRLPDTVVTTMRRADRNNRVFIDWTQNHPWKSTIAPYSLRGGTVPTVAAPVTWDEIAAVAATGDARSLVFVPAQVVARLDDHGDLTAAVAGVRQGLPVAPG